MTEYLDDRIASDLGALVPWWEELTFWSSRFGALLFDNIPLGTAIRGLDIGCATGFPLFELASSFGPDSRFTGIDVWRDALDRARGKAGFFGIGNVDIVQSDGARLPFRGSVFDLAVSNLGVNNFDDPDAVLRETFRVIKRGARLVLTTNLKGHMSEFYSVFRALLTSEMPEALPRLDQNEEHRGTAGLLTRRVEAAGFTIERLVEQSFPLRFADGTALLRHSLVRWFLGGWRAVVPPESERRIFALLEDRLNEVARAEGELRTTVPMLYLQAVKR